jgi:hypothetical protein
MLQHQTRRSWRRFLAHQNDILAGDYHFEIELMLNAFASGIMDVLTFFEFGVFTYNQAANIVIIAIGVFDDDPVAYPPIITSIAAFLTSGLLLAMMGKCLGSDTRAWLMALGLLQAGLLFAMAAVYWRRDEGLVSKGFNYGIIASMACVSGSQAVFARSVYVPDIWSNFDPFMSLGSVKLQNRSVFRGLLTVIILIFGTLWGLLCYIYVSVGFALTMTGAIRMLVVVAVMAHPTASRNDLEIELNDLA